MRAPPSDRASSPETHDDRCVPFVARLVRAAAVVDASDDVALAGEALPPDNEAPALAEGLDAAAGSLEGGGES